MTGGKIVQARQHQLIIGVGGTGKTTRLQTIVADQELGDDVIWLTGMPRRHLRKKIVVDVFESVPQAIVLDDLHWFETDALEYIAEQLENPLRQKLVLFAAQRPHYANNSLDDLASLLTRTQPTIHTSFLDHDQLAKEIATQTKHSVTEKKLAWFYTQSGGSIGLVSDILRSKWHETQNDDPPKDFIQSVSTRANKLEADAHQLALLHALAGPEGQAVAAQLASADTEKQLLASGLVHEKSLLTSVAHSLPKQQTTQELQAIYDTLAQATTDISQASSYALQGSATSEASVTILLQAAQQCYWNDPQKALLLLEKIAGCDDATNRAVNELLAKTRFRLGHTAYTNANLPFDIQAAQALQDLRWNDAQKLFNKAANISMEEIANAAAGKFAAATATTSSLASKLQQCLHATSQGDPQAIALVSQAATDYDRSATASNDTDQLLVTPHFVGALCALSLGDQNAAHLLVRQALEQTSGGPGEKRCFTLLDAYLELRAGNYKKAHQLALSPTNEIDAPDITWNLRDRLLWACLCAGLALRSGNTTQLREAWRSTEPIFLQASLSWLFGELLEDVLVVGTKLGATQRVEAIQATLRHQSSALKSNIHSSNALWRDLQLALTANDLPAIGKTVHSLTQSDADNQLVMLRQQAAVYWKQVVSKTLPTVEDLLLCADRFCAIADPWQGSRLLGQAALLVENSKDAKKLLERARSVTTELAADPTNDFAAFGLSERETDVAKSMIEGNTYKQIGAQLFISPKTVEHHVAKIKQKLKAKNRAEMLQILTQNTAHAT